MRGASVFSTLDLKNAFHRFKINEADQHKTAFTFEGIQYMFNGSPFGLKPVSSKLQRVINYIFHDTPYVSAFVEDIVIFSSNLDEHRIYVQDTIRRLI